MPRRDSTASRDRSPTSSLGTRTRARGHLGSAGRRALRCHRGQTARRASAHRSESSRTRWARRDVSRRGHRPGCNRPAPVSAPHASFSSLYCVAGTSRARDDAASMSLAHKAARGALWTVIASMGGRAIGVVATLVITRFPHPPQIGEVAAATVLAMSANWITIWGFGQYAVVHGRGEHALEVTSE